MDEFLMRRILELEKKVEAMEAGLRVMSKSILHLAQIERERAALHNKEMNALQDANENLYRMVAEVGALLGLGGKGEV